MKVVSGSAAQQV